MICEEIRGRGRVGKNAIPEQYDLLRMAQLIICGYVKPWNRREVGSIRVRGLQDAKRISN
jgi:hypothetical protein